MARPTCTLSTSNPRRSVDWLSLIRRRTSSVTRFSSFDILFFIALRRFPPRPLRPYLLSSPKLFLTFLFYYLLIYFFRSLVPSSLSAYYSSLLFTSFRIYFFLFSS